MLSFALSPSVVEVLVYLSTHWHPLTAAYTCWSFHTASCLTSKDYCHFTTAIATSNLKYFISDCLRIDAAASKVLARALTQSKTLENVKVEEDPMDSKVARALVEAINHSIVWRNWWLDCIDEEAVSECSFPTDRVEFIMYEFITCWWVTSCHSCCCYFHRLTG